MVVALGIPINLLFSITFGIGAGLAALAGVLNAPIRACFPMGSYPHALLCCGHIGMGSFWGAVIGGLLWCDSELHCGNFSAMSEVIVSHGDCSGSTGHCRNEGLLE
jgi:branched-subunit amino acid ABC-type transport system permease component